MRLTRRPLTVPEVTREPTNLGPAMDALVTESRRRQEPLGLERDYDLLRDHFDHLNFLLESQSAGFLPAGDPIRQFLRQGAEAIASPDYNFSMLNYLERYPEKRGGPERSPYLEWIKRGRDAREIADPAFGIESMARVLGLEPEDVVRELVSTREDVMQRLRTGELGRMFAQAAEIEPLVGATWPETARTRLLPLGGRFVVQQAATVQACQQEAGYRRARLVIVTDRPRFGVGRTVVSDLARGMVGAIAADDVVVVYTELAPPLAEAPPPLPPGVRQVDFATRAAGMPEDHRHQALTSLLRSFGADAIVNVGSGELYRATTPYGRALAISERLFYFFGGFTQKPAGNWESWSLRWFYAGLGIATGFITDSDDVRDSLTEMYQLGDVDRARIHVLRAPADPDIAPVSPASPPGTSRRPVVHWAGRPERRSRMDVAREVARRMPDVDFRFHITGGMSVLSAADLPANVRMEQRPGRVTDADLSDADAWLYTWAWEGASTLLLDLAMTEIPIVAGAAAGVGEIVSEADAWLVAGGQDPAAYELALRQLLADPGSARRRASVLRERVSRERRLNVYRESAASLLLNPADETVR